MSSPNTCTWKTRSLRTALICSTLTGTTVALSMACLFFAPASQAQVVKGATATPAGSAAQFHERLRGSLQGRTSAKIANPRAGNFDNSAIIVVCRNQKQNADREAQQMRAFFNNPASKPATAMGDGSVRVADAAKTGGTAGITDGASQTAKTGGAAGNLPAVQRGDKRAGPGGPSLSGPLKTESASGNQSPGSPASSASASHAICPPNIATISGLPTVLFSPSTLFNPYTIKGCGFGNQVGKVYLTGPFYGGKVQLNVESIGGSRGAPPRAAWNDTAIIVTVDPNVTGELDQENVTLVIEPAAGSPIQKSGNQFLAGREDVTLKTIPKSAVQFYNGIVTGVGGKKAGSLTPSGSTTTTTLSVTTPELLYFTPSQSPAGFSAEVFRGGTTSFFSTGSDLFDMSGLARGFLAESFQLYQPANPTGCDKGTGGSEGSWNAIWSGTNISVAWGEFQCHLPWMGGGPDVWSDYSLSVLVKGPRGIDPWTGRRPLSLVAPAHTLAH